MNRRDFLSKSSKIACVCALGSTTSIFTSCSDTMNSEPEDTTGIELEFDLSSTDFLALQNNGGSVVTEGNEIDSRGILLLRSNTEIKAFTRRCTHAGYELLPFSNGISTCSSGHGGQFNTSGVAVSDPATSSLKSYQTELSDNILTVYGS